MARTEAEYISALVFHVLDFLAVFETGYQSPFHAVILLSAGVV